MTYTCACCGIQFEDRYRVRQYCSKACYRAHGTKQTRVTRKDAGTRKSPYVEETCFTCGKLFERRASEVRTSGFAFCSRECFKAGGASHVNRVATGKIGRPNHPDLQSTIRPEAPSEVSVAAEKYGKPTGWIMDKGYLWYVWHTHPAVTPGKTTRIGEHRVVAFEHLGHEIKGMDIDHINGDKLDNRWNNLRALTRHEHLKRTTRDQGPAAFLTWAKEYHPEILAEFGQQPV